MRRIVMAAIISAFVPMAVAATELRIGFTTDALTLDPGNHRLRDTETILRLMYDGLVTHDATMQVVPDLAESWRLVDPRTYEFTLRRGVHFHGGAELTAADVVFTFQRLLRNGAMDGQTSPRKSLLGPVTDVQAIDDHTVRFILSSPWPVLPAMLTFQEVVSRATGERLGAKGMATQEDGTGGFRLLDWRRGDQMVLQRVGQGCVERVILKFIPENASRVAALLAGDVDIVNELPVFNIRQIEAGGGARVAAVNGTRSFFVALNLDKPPFDDVRVRHAANYALNKKLIIDRILAGRAIALNGVLSPDAFGFNPDLPAYGFDARRAKALLAEAGHPNGIDVTMDVEGASRETAEAVASVLTQAGIRTKVAVGETSTVRQKWAPTSKREGDMFLVSWGNGSLDPSDIFVPTLRTKGSGNFADFSNAEVDALLDAADIEGDTAKRADLYRRAQVIVSHEAPWIFLWLPQDIYGVSNRVSGWQPAADGRLNLRDACVK